VFPIFKIAINLEHKSRFVKKVSLFLNVILFVVSVVVFHDLLAQSEKIDQNEISAEKKKPWKFDCEEKRECMRKCSSMSVFQYNGKDQSYANQIRTECFRDCTSQVDCNKDR